MLNLHSIVRSAITAIHDDEKLTLYRSKGATNQGGIMTPAFDAVELVGNFQSENANLQLVNGLSTTELSKRLYLYADEALAVKPYAVLKPIARGGDFIKDKFGCWWKVSAVLEDYSADGWILLKVTLLDGAPAEIGEDESDD